VSLWRRVFTERRSVIVPLATVLAINLVVLAAVVLPLQASVSGDESRAEDVKLDLAVARRAERLANDTRSSKVRADEELKQFYTDVLPSGLSEARDLLFLQMRTLSQKTGVAFSNSTFEPEAVEDSSLVRLRVDTVLTGPYPNIRRFIYELETADEFFIIESLKLGQSNLSSPTGGALQIVLQVSTYYIGGTP